MRLTVERVPGTACRYRGVKNFSEADCANCLSEMRARSYPEEYSPTFEAGAPSSRRFFGVIVAGIVCVHTR